MKPYLSFVVASRNDNHGGDLAKRMRIFVRGLLAQTRRFNLPAELIIVVWNPVPDEPGLDEYLPAPGPDDLLTIRYITVPAEIHNSYRFANKLGIYQMIAKNVGIRRAKADFVLCTNIDLLFSDALMKLLSAKNLDPKAYYRCNRCDILAELQEDWSIEEQLHFSQAHVVRRFGKNPDYPNLHGFPAWIYKNKRMARMANKLAAARKFGADPVEETFNEVDSNACGDFTLMHRTAWEDIQGYPELDMYSIHIDTMGVLAARALGYKQVVFPVEACTYHMEHQNGWESLTAVEKINFIHERPGIGFDIVSDAGKALIRHKSRFNFNRPDWGFTGQTFEEIIKRPQAVEA